MRKIINKNIFQSYALLFILLYPSHPFLIYISHPISGTGTTSAQYIYSLHSQIRGENKNWQSAILSPQWNSML